MTSVKDPGLWNPDRYLWNMVQPFGRKVLAVALAMLFGVMLLPQGLLHACDSGHSDHAVQFGEGDAEVSASCGICDLAMPHFLGAEAPGIRTIQLILGEHSAALVQQVSLATIIVPGDRGPPGTV